MRLLFVKNFLGLRLRDKPILKEGRVSPYHLTQLKE
jgi:hypothetical protein